MKSKKLRTENWDKEINELDEFFKSANLPRTLNLSEWETINNTQGFIDSHMTLVKAQNGIPCFRPYLKRLKRLKGLLEQTKLSQVNLHE